MAGLEWVGINMRREVGTMLVRLAKNRGMGRYAILRPKPTRPTKPRTVALTYIPTDSLSRGWTGRYCSDARGPVLPPWRHR